MNTSRRSLCASLPLWAAATALAADQKPLPSFVEPYDQLPVHRKDGNESRPILDGLAHSGDHIEVHETTLAAGNSPHPPHQHEHEELFLMMKGTLSVTIAGKTSLIGPGSAAFVHTGELHGVKNPGPGEAQYFVVATGV